jgi:ActR/RegA family two-component response regulator
MTNELIAAVRAHANTNWEKGGWDFLAECWDDDDIVRAIGNAKTVRGAIANCSRQVRILDLHRREMQGGWW